VCCVFYQVDRGYIEDSFNLYGLGSYVHQFKESLDVILDRRYVGQSSQPARACCPCPCPGLPTRHPAMGPPLRAAEDGMKTEDDQEEEGVDGNRSRRQGPLRS
jgi:hypothetical protein